MPNLPTPQDGTEASPCQRCQRLKLKCIYQKRRRRGQKAAAEAAAAAADGADLGSETDESEDDKPAKRPAHGDAFTRPPLVTERSFTMSHSSPIRQAVNTQAPTSSTRLELGNGLTTPKLVSNGYSSSLTNGNSSFAPPSLGMSDHRDANGSSNMGYNMSPHSLSSSALSGRNGVPSHARRAQMVDVSERLDPNLPEEGPGGPVNPTVGSLRLHQLDHVFFETTESKQSDPVALHYLSLIEADEILQFFHRHLNPMIAILDPNLHTLDYIRGSTILFTAVIAVGSRFIRKELHQPLLTHAQMILNRATATGDVNIGIIQALLILMYWKAPSDRSAWVKIGIAIRLGYQMGMHIPRTEPLPEDERLARIIRNAERTWFCTSCFDLGYSDMFELPATIRLEELGEVEAWAREGPYNCGPDMHVASSVSTHPSHILWIRYKQMRNSLPVEWCRSVLNDVYSQYQRHMDHWFPHDDLEWCTPEEARSLRWFDIWNLLKVKHEFLNYATPDEMALTLHECLGIASMFVRQTERLAEDTYLTYLQDTLSAVLSLFGTVLYKLFWRVDVSQKQQIIDAIKRIHTCCSKVAAGEDDAPTAFVARFFHRVLQKITVEPTAASPVVMMQEAAISLPNPSDQVLPEHVITDIHEFLRMSVFPLRDNVDIDDQYWATLLATSTMDLGQNGLGGGMLGL
ncbi:Protein priB [Vanrija pseudolonga]|uniref:Protein priB n=1 Tax=Vanrija pseudolonga TaxID=143232 RepID=A0AAF0YDM3_9TREE|nr:Protein priB [Vanrija pseudolonga]